MNIIERSATLGHQYRFLVSKWLGSDYDGEYEYEYDEGIPP